MTHGHLEEQAAHFAAVVRPTIAHLVLLVPSPPVQPVSHPTGNGRDEEIKHVLKRAK